MQKYIMELIGTFFLVLTIGLAGATPMGPLAIGATLTAIIYMGGHISKAHYNPAVSVAALLIKGWFSQSDFVPYLIAQIGGALLAALAVLVITGQTFAPAPAADTSLVGALLVEILFTFALVLVIFNVAVSKGTAGNSFYGLAIGLTIVGAAFAGGPISGGAYNPAVGLGPILVDVLFGGGSIANLWLYLVGPLLGGIAAVYVFKVQESIYEEQQSAHH